MDAVGIALAVLVGGIIGRLLIALIDFIIRKKMS